MVGKYPGWRTMTKAQRYNARMERIFDEARVRRGGGPINYTTEDWTTSVFDVQAEPMRSTITIPAGTRVKLIENPMGMAWVVDDVPLLVKLTGNTHDPKYRYVYVPLKIVGEAHC